MLPLFFNKTFSKHTCLNVKEHALMFVNISKQYSVEWNAVFVIEIWSIQNLDASNNSSKVSVLIRHDSKYKRLTREITMSAPARRSFLPIFVKSVFECFEVVEITQVSYVLKCKKLIAITILLFLNCGLFSN